MEKHQAKYVPASVELTSFNCPHCGAFSNQTWFTLHGQRLGNNATPRLVNELTVISDADWRQMEATMEPARLAVAKRQHEVDRKLRNGDIHMKSQSKNPYELRKTDNLHVNLCYACSSVSVWRKDKLLYPSTSTVPSPNPDMPEDIATDYREADSILANSPRGAAALLRLAIQKLCAHLGYEKKNINNAIGAMVADGLPQQIQQAWDTIRVVGNESVHPGTLDMKDNRDTATKLFSLINVIVQDRISNPKAIEKMYNTVVPEDKRKGIEDRDKS